MKFRLAKRKKLQRMKKGKDNSHKQQRERKKAGDKDIRKHRATTGNRKTHLDQHQEHQW